MANKFIKKKETTSLLRIKKNTLKHKYYQIWWSYNLSIQN